MINPTRGFGSDNHSGVHHEVLSAIARVNEGHAHAYGDDAFTLEAQKKIAGMFGEKASCFFVFNGTGANCLALSACIEPFESAVCTDSAHIHVDECGAPERFTGGKLIPLSTEDGKLYVSSLERQLEKHLLARGNQHHSQTRVLSVSQSTEWGTVYSVEELKALGQFARAHDLFFHVDGARLSNAAVALNVDFKTMIAGTGVDVLSLGGTKNGLLGAEAVVFLNPELAHDFKFRRKQAAQLHSKMRFISAQLMALYDGDLWSRNASHANAMAKKLESGLKHIEQVEIVQRVQANVVFAKVSPSFVDTYASEFKFYVWEAGPRPIIRLMTSFDTTEEDVSRLLDAFKKDQSA